MSFRVIEIILKLGQFAFRHYENVFVVILGLFTVRFGHLYTFLNNVATRDAILVYIIKRFLSTSYMLGSNELHLFINNSLSDLKSADVWSTCLVVHRASALMG